MSGLTVLILDPPYGDTADEEAIDNGVGSATMKWYIGLILGLSLALGASPSRGEWQMMVHRNGQVVARFMVADVDSVTFRAPIGSCVAPDGSCTQTTESACTGVWTLDGVCTPDAPAQVVGACCDAATGACAVTAAVGCTGSWAQAGVCVPNPCGQASLQGPGRPKMPGLPSQPRWTKGR